MPKQVQNAAPPTGIGKFFFRAPIKLYDIGLGWMLGKRFLLLNHIGRKSGLPRRAVVEVVDYDAATDTYFIASGYGKKSQWYKNIIAHPEITIQVGRRKLAVTAVPLSPDDSGEKMVQYAKRNPIAAKNITRFVGYEIDGSDDGYRAIGRDIVPFIALQPTAILSESEGLPAWPFIAGLLSLPLVGLLRKKLKPKEAQEP